MTTYEDVGVVTEEIPCCECGTVTVVHALGFAALPDITTYRGSCCRIYKEEPCENA